MKPNRKIRNATPTVYCGIQYRSKLEATFAKLLKEQGIAFQYEQETWELLPKQRYAGKCVRPITYTPDFIIGDYVVEVKGYRNDVFPVKRKLIIKYILDNRPGTIFIEARSVRDMQMAIDLIKQQDKLNE